jgi:hypothetical protein
MMIMIGVFHALAGIVAIAEDDLIVEGADYAFQFDVTAWGWIHLIVGIVVFLSGFGIFSGNVFARTVGVFVALGSAIAAFAWLPYYPVWGVIVIAIDVAVIWALTAHGRDITVD